MSFKPLKPLNFTVTNVATGEKVVIGEVCASGFVSVAAPVGFNATETRDFADWLMRAAAWVDWINGKKQVEYKAELLRKLMNND